MFGIFKKKKVNNQEVPLEVQTESAKITAVGRVISGHPSDSITPAKLKGLFDEAESGDITAQHELFVDIEERDSAIAAAFGTRKRAILTLDYHIAEPSNANAAEEKLTEAVKNMLDSLGNVEDVFMDMMDAVGHGFAPLEIKWQFKDGLWYPESLSHRPQAWFTWDKDDNLLLKTPDNQLGEPLWPLAWMVHIHKTRSVQQARNGLFRTLAWLYMFKHYSVHDFAEFLELYGMPIRIGKYGAGATTEEKRTLLRAVADIGHNAAGIMPEGMAIELHNAASGNANSNPFMTMVEWCEKSAARLILGQTLTSGADGQSSTNALGVIHNEVRRDLLVSDAKQLAQSLTKQLIVPFLQLNFANVDLRRLPCFEFDTREVEDLTKFSEAIPKLVDIGVPIPESWVREKLAIPELRDGETALQRPVVMNPIMAGLSQQHEDKCPCCGEGSRLAALSSKASPKSVQDKQGLLDETINSALQEPDFNAQLNPILRQAVAALSQCNSYAEAEAALVALYPNLDNSEFNMYMATALSVSDFLGQSHG